MITDSWRQHYYRNACLLLLLLSLLPAAASRAAEIEGVRFADSVTVAGRELRLVGTGMQRYLLVYKVCVAALYLPAGTAPGQALDDVPKHLEIHYFHKIKAAQFAELTAKGVRDNATPARFRAVRERLEAFCQAYENVRPGDRYSLSYAPETGSTLALNGALKKTVPGADFAAALFAVWLGAKPVTEGLKQGLLGGGGK